MANDFIIDDSTNNDLLFPASHARGLVARDYNVQPMTFGASPDQIPIIPRSEWDARIDEQEARQSSLEHVRMTGDGGNMIRSLDQNGQGFCWAYSTTMAVMLVRAMNNQPHVRLSAHAIGCKVKNFRDEGGWAALSAQFHREHGCPSVDFWQEKSMSRSNDNAATWENAAKHRVTEDFADLTKSVYDQNLTVDQIASCLLQNIPVAVDYNEWGHSICAIRWVRIERGSYGPKIINSWTDQWGDRGMGVIQRGWTVDGAVAIGVTGGSQV